MLRVGQLNCHWPSGTFARSCLVSVLATKPLGNVPFSWVPQAWGMGHRIPNVFFCSGRKRAHKHKLFALVGQTAGCPRVNWPKKFMCSPRNTGNINVSFWLTGGLSQGCLDFQKVYVLKAYVPFSCPIFQILDRSFRRANSC